jgi:hypothetical protein
VGAIGGALAAAALPAVIEAEVLKDDRISSVEVTITRDVSQKSETLEIALLITPVDAEETFDLTLSVSDVDTSIVGTLP